MAHRRTKAREYTIHAIMRPRLAVSSLAIAIAVSAAMPRAQSSVPPSAPGKKNPLLKLAEPWPDADTLKANRIEAENRPLFRKTEPLEFTLTAAFRVINKDHNPESKVRYPGVLTVAASDGTPRDIPVKLSARGHFRRMSRNCSDVPLRVEFPKDGLGGTPFEGQTTLKLGTGCDDSKEYEQITLREYLSYPMFNLVTPTSFRARLARATYVDEKSKKKNGPRYALFIEHENDVARRAEGRIVELPRVVFKDLHDETLTRMMLFEYMIGNTDMSIYAIHNVRLVQKPNRTLLPVPYDFDLSGLVHAPYAAPDRNLGLRSVVDRLYRGPCRSLDEFESSAAAFRARRTEILALTDSLPDLERASRNEMREYLESFFRTIDKPASVNKTFVDGCKPKPTM
jgi:hypothetical protein